MTVNSPSTSMATISDGGDRNPTKTTPENLKEKVSNSTLVAKGAINANMNSKDEEPSFEAELPSMMNSAPIEFPEGGRRAWLTILGAFLIQYSSFGYINAFGVYQDLYVREYLESYSPSAIGWIGGVQIFLTFSAGAFTGRIFDKGYFYHLLAASILLHAIALFMLSLSHKNEYYQVFLTNGIVLGLAVGISYVPSIGIAAHYFQKRRPIAVGIISSGSALGAVIHPIMLNSFFANPKIGFHNGVRISGAMNVALLLIAAALMRTRLPPRSVNVSASQIKSWLNPKKDLAYSVYFLSAAPSFLGLFLPVFYIQLYAILHGVEEGFSFYLLSILNAASLLGRVLPALLAGRVGVFNLGSFVMLSAGVVILCWLPVHDVAGTTLFCIFFGFTSGSAIALSPAMLAHLAKDHSEIGQRMGMYFGFGGIFGLFATPIAGALLTRDYEWTGPIIFAGIMLIIAGLIFTASRFVVAKARGTHRI